MTPAALAACQRRAEERAICQNVRVHPIAGNASLFAATSISTSPNGFWLVSVDVAGEPTCTCPAGQAGRPCKHAEAVKMHLHECRMSAETKARHQRDMRQLAEIFEW